MTVLDHGSVELLDLLGDDMTPAMAARVSFGGGLYEDAERNLALLERLYREGHWATLEHIVLRFSVTAPIFVLRQWMRHRIGSYNELSGRYKTASDLFYIPSLERIEDEQDRETIIEAAAQSRAAYQTLIHYGVSKELARIILPLNLYSSMIWTVNLRSLWNFLELRGDEHAQWEIRQYAQAIEETVASRLPENHRLWVQYR